jgi:hypothetical protein
MSKSLIRKNQLHPDIADLVSGYGNDFFITQQELDQALLGLEADFNLSSIVYTTGNQEVEGIKNFTVRPTLNGIGIATTGEAGGSTAFDGFRSITRTNINGVTPGGTDVVTFLNNLFYPFTQATITLNSFNTVYELGTTLSTVSAIGSITTGSLRLNQITNLETFVGSNGVPQIITQPSTNFTINAIVNLTNTANNITVRANSRDVNNQVVQITSDNATINFAAPWYYGTGAANLSPTQIQSLFTGPLKKVELPSNKTIEVTANNQKIYFAYPQSWGVLTSIKDGNNFENINGWLNRTNLSFTLANGSSHIYTVRETSLLNTFITPFNYTFIF